jgi:hypothetical protein
MILRDDGETILAGGSMSELEICDVPEQRDDWHTRWLKMQSAYAEYRRSSEALASTRQPDDEQVNEGCLRLNMLEADQRVAFERYMDARISFLESRFDEFNKPDVCPPDKAMDPAAPEGGSRLKAWFSMANVRPVLQTLAVLLLCTTAFSLILEQARIRDLEQDREGLRQAILRTTQELQMLRQKVGVGPPVLGPGPQVEPTPFAAGVTPKEPQNPAVRKPGNEANSTRPHSPHPATNAKRTPAPEASSRMSRTRSTHPFSLSPSRNFKRVGPLSVWLKSVDAKRGTASLSISTGTLQVEVQRLRLEEPIWLNTGKADHPLGLVADRIRANRLDGHLVEPVSAKPELKATQFRSNSDSPQ